MSVFPPYKHAVVWFCICKLRVNCSQCCVYKCACSVCVIPCKDVGCVGSVGVFIRSVLKSMSTDAFITKQIRDTFLEDICCIFDTKALLPETDSVLCREAGALSRWWSFQESFIPLENPLYIPALKQISTHNAKNAISIGMDKPMLLFAMSLTCSCSPQTSNSIELSRVTVLNNSAKAVPHFTLLKILHKNSQIWLLILIFLTSDLLPDGQTQVGWWR